MARLLAYKIGCCRVIVERWIIGQHGAKSTLPVLIIDNEAEVTVLNTELSLWREIERKCIEVEGMVLSSNVNLYSAKLRGVVDTWLLSSSRNGVIIQHWLTPEQREPEMLHSFTVPVSACDELAALAKEVMKEFSKQILSHQPANNADVDDIPF